VRVAGAEVCVEGGKDADWESPAARVVGREKKAVDKVDLPRGMKARRTSSLSIHGATCAVLATTGATRPEARESEREELAARKVEESGQDVEVLAKRRTEKKTAWEVAGARTRERGMSTPASLQILLTRI